MEEIELGFGKFKVWPICWCKDDGRVVKNKYIMTYIC